MKKLNLKKVKLIFALIFCVLVVTSSFFLPDMLLKATRSSTTNDIIVAPEKYYVESGNAMARSTSSRLNSLDRIKLISGSWESTGRQCDISEGFLTENQAITLAKNNLDEFYSVGVFPYSISSNYNNWYSWDTKLYCYTDSLFNTYSAYLWVINFTKFDNSISHTIYMTESGVIIGAETTDTTNNTNKIISAYTDSSAQAIFCDQEITLISKEKAPENTTLSDAYPETNLSTAQEKDIYILDLSTSDGAVEKYYVYQYKNDEIYGIGIEPCPQ